MKIPFMTICSLSGFWKSKMEKYNVSKALASYLQLAIRGPDVVNPWFDSRRKQVLDDELETYLTVNNLTLSEMVTLLSPTCEEVIVGCFSPRQDRYSSDCCRDLFTPTITTLGLCYTTLTKGASLLLNQTIAGLIGGHRILFAVNSHEYMEYDSNVVSTTTLAEEGLHVSLSNFDLTPNVATNMQALRISPNTAASVALSVTTLDQSERYLGVWPWSTSDCVRERDFWAMSDEGKAHTESNLYYNIRYRTCPLAITNCSTLPYRFTNDTTAECEPKSILHHRVQAEKMEACLQEHLHSNTSQQYSLCVRTSINQQQSFTTLLKDTLQEQQGISIPPNVTVSMLNVYYTQLGYTEYYERVPTIHTWFSDLGGQMGLFLGASFITLVELFFTICHVLRAFLTKTVKTLYRKTRSCITTFTTSGQDHHPA